MILEQKEITKINNYLVAIRALCETARNENTDSIIQILYDIEKITCREEEKEIQDFKETNHKLAETCIARKKRIDELEKENAELKDKNKALEQYADLADAKVDEVKSKLPKAKEIILKLYNAGRDVLMCRAEEKAYDNLSEAISDRSIEQFLSEVGHE